ncbi:MAG: potassium transporter Kup [Sphingomonadaceae bacterium]|nr:potassium transporter Kup [Sphingomonadaceae bacterium]
MTAPPVTAKAAASAEARVGANTPAGAPGAHLALPDSHAPHGRFSALAVGAIGVVFGDIGTSPLYALKECFIGHHKLTVDPLHVNGVLSIMFWTMIVIVTVKYVFITLRADNRGEGGSLSLFALLVRNVGLGRGRWLMLLGIMATALFFGDAIITPAISVLSAMEGLTTVEARLQPMVLPGSLVILFGLFLIQSRGTEKVGRLFGPVMLVYFAVLAVLGVRQIALNPDIISALSPHHAVLFITHDPKLAFLALGSIVLAVTGAEALYADMGHFGRKPIGLSWLAVVLPALMLNYLGQGALVLTDPASIENPFYLMAPDEFRLPMVILATMATVIASQAVISGAFSVTRQAVQLGYLPRLRILHTSASAYGQIYVPFMNWLLLLLIVLLVLGFRESSNLASAYGIAVTGTMFITTCMIAVLITNVWGWKRIYSWPLIGLLLLFDGAYLASNLTKIVDGGWFPLMIGAIAFLLLTTWARGRALMMSRLRESAMPVDVFIRSASNSATRVPGTAVFMTSSPNGVPHALLHNLKHNKVLHERILILTVNVAEVPVVDDENRIEVMDLGENFYRVVLHYGFMQEPNVPEALKRLANCGPKVKMMETSFFLARQTLLASERPGMPVWREKLFAWLLQNAESAMSFFKLPTNRVVELGSQVEI